jgi:poly(hydroxyalkanoate) depolymerase family esterase
MHTYTPPGLPENAPLVVALHGCTQSALDYSSHSGWPELADRYGFALVFPQQSRTNNALRCFNWYKPAADSRGVGEAASIKSMVDYQKAHLSIDAEQVFLTGLSAGAAMTANLLADYPDVFAGGAIHSGLPAKCATNLIQATNCQHHDQHLTPAQWAATVRRSAPDYTGSYPRVAIWHGTADHIVAPVNATELRDQWTAVHGLGQTPASTRHLTGGTTETTYTVASGTPMVALFEVSGMGHGLAVHPGIGPAECGQTGTYFLDYIGSSYYTAQFWGLTEAGPTGTAHATPNPAPEHGPDRPVRDRQQRRPHRARWPRPPRRWPRLRRRI